MKSKNKLFFLAGIVLGVVNWPSPFLFFVRHFIQTGNISGLIIDNAEANINNLLGSGILIVDTVIVVMLLFILEVSRIRYNE